MKAKFFLCSLAIIFSGVLMFSSSAVARMACDPDCLAPAKTAFQGCIADCKEAFQDAKDSCRNIDPECAEDCRLKYDGCIVPQLTQLAECKATECNVPLAVAVANCRAMYPKGEDRDKCIDQAQVVAFQCRDECREAANPALKICRDAFKECMIGCKLLPPPAP
jgi:hypothetical protein